MVYSATFLSCYGKIKICIKKKCLLGLFSLSLLFFQFYNKISNWFPVVLNGVLDHGVKRGGVVAQGLASPGPRKFARPVTEACYRRLMVS